MKCRLTASLLIAALTMSASSKTIAADLATYKCSYDRFSDGDELAKTKESLNLIFVTGENGEATLVGNNGSSKVTGFWNPGQQGVGFLEVTQTGNLMTTTIDSLRKSVHSRHTIIGGRLVPQQYYGECVIQ